MKPELDFESAAIEWPGMSEAARFASRARLLGLPFSPIVHLSPGTLADPEAVRAGTIAMSIDGGRTAYIAPDEDALPGVMRWLNAHPEARSRLCVSTRTAIRAALRRAGGRDHVQDAVTRLEKRWPEFSARRVLTRRQVVAATLIAVVVGAFAWVAPSAVLGVVDAVGIAYFLGISALRFVAARMIPQRLREARRSRHVSPRVPDEELPVYTILVPLYREAAVLPDLVAALDRIDWPADKLDIKLLLEADDERTIAAARIAAPRPPYEIVVVPPGGPRTKPKALSYALPFALGEFVTVYDAEDKPHPRQLRAAYDCFREAGPDLACLQAALVVDNPGDGWLARSFTIEYAAVFDGLLPAIADFGMPMPLGGTSNHFRRAALEATGGWDPFNVTEDADLGLRLARFGYRTATIAVPTLEEAPAAFGPWLRQRTRWFKGWMQTWLVHTRHPVRLARQLGLRGMIGFNLIGTAIVVSSIVYPVYLFTLIALLANPVKLLGGDTITAFVASAHVLNLCAGYLAMIILGGRALRVRGRGREARGLVFLPVYWFLMSLASYRAVFQLVVQPHRWEKTPHRRRRSGFHEKGRAPRYRPGDNGDRAFASASVREMARAPSK